MRAVAVESNHAPLMTFYEVCKHRSEAGGETFTFLCNYHHFTACQLRQFVYVGVRAHDGNFYMAQ